MYRRFVIEENIKLFERSLLSDDLDRQQTAIVTRLLARAREELMGRQQETEAYPSMLQTQPIS